MVRIILFEFAIVVELGHVGVKSNVLETEFVRTWEPRDRCCCGCMCPVPAD